jgi:hypothetical protein
VPVEPTAALSGLSSPFARVARGAVASSAAAVAAVVVPAVASARIAAAVVSWALRCIGAASQQSIVMPGPLPPLRPGRMSELSHLSGTCELFRPLAEWYR